MAVELDDAAAFRHPDWSRFGFAVDPAGGSPVRLA
jgi:hypothetical protein